MLPPVTSPIQAQNPQNQGLQANAPRPGQVFPFSMQENVHQSVQDSTFAHIEPTMSAPHAHSTNLVAEVGSRSHPQHPKETECMQLPREEGEGALASLPRITVDDLALIPLTPLSILESPRDQSPVPPSEHGLDWSLTQGSPIGANPKRSVPSPASTAMQPATPKRAFTGSLAMDGQESAWPQVSPLSQSNPSFSQFDPCLSSPPPETEQRGWVSHIPPRGRRRTRRRRLDHAERICRPGKRRHDKVASKLPLARRR